MSPIPAVDEQMHQRAHDALVRTLGAAAIINALYQRVPEESRPLLAMVGSNATEAARRVYATIECIRDVTMRPFMKSELLAELFVVVEPALVVLLQSAKLAEAVATALVANPQQVKTGQLLRAAEDTLGDPASTVRLQDVRELLNARVALWRRSMQLDDSAWELHDTVRDALDSESSFSRRRVH